MSNYAIRFSAIDEDGRQFPCACHSSPAYWVIMTAYPVYGVGKWGKVLIPIPRAHLGPDLPTQLFANSFNTLDDMFIHPEDYSE